MKVQLPCEIGHHHHSALQDPNKQGFLTGKVAFDFSRHPSNSFPDLLGSENDRLDVLCYIVKLHDALPFL
jgi:hypothetical protein